jgi:hypothetical protein
LSEFEFIRLVKSLREGGFFSAAEYLEKWSFLLMVAETVEWRIKVWLNKEVSDG